MVVKLSHIAGEFFFIQYWVVRTWKVRFVVSLPRDGNLQYRDATYLLASRALLKQRGGSPASASRAFSGVDWRSPYAVLIA